MASFLALFQNKTKEVSRQTELISGDGEFNEAGLKDFIKCVKLHQCGVSYAVVAVIGPQSSGKSTLLNHLFHTDFKKMNAEDGRSQTTKGICIANALNMKSFTMVLDLEGTDGQERGQDDTAFEKQSALFALVVADIVLINMWCHDIGRENAANRPLLKTIFEVMMRIFRSSPRKTTLHSVIRDKTRIWEIVPKTHDFKDTPLSEFFNVVVTALSHYIHEKKQFEEEVGRLRNRISDSISPGGVVDGDRRGVVPTKGFSLHVKNLWETIKQNKDLDLPTHKEMVATVQCEKIANEKLTLFASNKDWLTVEAAAETGFVSGFSAKINSILSGYLSEYDSESEYFEEDVRNEKRQNLESKAFELVRPAYINTLGHLRSEAFQSFQIQLEKLLNKGEGFAESVRTCQLSCELEFDQRYCSDAAIEHAKWDASTVCKELLRDIQNHSLHVRTDKLPQLVEQHRERLSSKIAKHLNRVFNLRDEVDISWASIRTFLKRECDSAASALSSDVVVFELDQPTLEQKVHDLKQYARNLVENKFEEETENVLQLMEERFVLALEKKEEPFPKCLKLLSTMAVIRLDEGDDDGVEKLVSSLLHRDCGVEVSGDDPLALCTWEKVPPQLTLITPVECTAMWLKFKQDIQTKLEQTASVDEDEESKSLPYWAKVGVWVLGVARFVWLIWRRRIDLAIPLLTTLGVGGIELVIVCPKPLKEKVKNGCNRMKETYCQILKKLEEALKKFYDFMQGLFSEKSNVKVAA